MVQKFAMRRRPSTDAIDKCCVATFLAVSSVNRGEENWVTNPKRARYQDKTVRLRQLFRVLLFRFTQILQEEVEFPSKH
jgi:hypothetical protein